MAVFNWEYLSFVNFDATWIYREVLLLPVLIVGLWFLWMRIVNSTMKDKSLPKVVDLSEAYQEAIIQDALSTDDEDDDEDEAAAAKEDKAAEATCKEDLNAKKED